MAILYNHKEHLFVSALLNCSAKQGNRSAKWESGNLKFISNSESK